MQRQEQLPKPVYVYQEALSWVTRESYAMAIKTLADLHTNELQDLVSAAGLLAGLADEEVQHRTKTNQL